MTALRVKNVARLNLDENLHWTRSSRRGVCHLVVDRRHVKNQVDRDYELEGQTVELLKFFLDLPTVAGRPGADGCLRDVMGPGRSTRSFSGDASRRSFASVLGLLVNVHLFRSLGTKIYLDKHPGAYEVARLVLGHKHLSTTTSAYTGMESISAAKMFDRTLRDRREQARDRPNRPSGRSSR